MRRSHSRKQPPWLTPPSYFGRVRKKAEDTWTLLESDPQLAGPWHQLFSQVQNPRHVLSELLQNADDVGATIAEAKISDGYFEFSHNGQDFNEDQFLSLCRFGYSNKRTFFTIGFRGIGFKSTFSLGDSVDVLTPTLAVCFERERFTLPHWLEGEGSRNTTLIRIPIKDNRIKKELRKNLQDWAQDTIPLLFFRNLGKLQVEDITLQVEDLGTGPVAGSRKVRLPGNEGEELFIITSPEEDLPDEVLEEIIKERGIFDEDEDYPPCRVEIVIGSQEEHTLYVVLPTSVNSLLPFSFNGPFIQDPSRERIKDPNTSPTNRWLLNRVGKLAARSIIEWIGNERIEPQERVDAYKLLPSREIKEGSLGADCHRYVLEAMESELERQKITLSSALTLHNSEECFLMPASLYSVWDTRELAELFGYEGDTMVHEEAARFYGGNLCEWELARMIDEDEVLDKLRTESVPKPQSREQLITLWDFVDKVVEWDYYGSERKNIKLLPVIGMDRLIAADSIIRLPAAKEKRVPKDVLEFLAKFVNAMDQQWFQLDDEEENPIIYDTLRAIKLEKSSSFKQIIEKASQKVFSQETVDTDICVCLAESAAALDVDVPKGFCYAMRDDHFREIEEYVLYRNPDEFDSVFPKDWSSRHFLDKKYFKEPKLIRQSRWETWLKSDKSGLLPFAGFNKHEENIWGQDNVETILREAGVEPPSQYKYVPQRFRVYDRDFDENLVQYWEISAESKPEIWVKVLEEVLNSPVWYWEKCLYAKVTQVSQSGSEVTISSNAITTQWIKRFRGLRCIPDEYGDLYSPSELLMRTPDTAALSGVERFVHPDLDQEVNRPLLKLLGVRDTPTDIDGVLARLRDLSKIEDPSVLISEISKWYEALARILARAPSDTAETVRQAFQDSSLVLTHEMNWVCSSDAFRFPSIDVEEGDPIVHESFRDNPLWSHIGLPEKPSLERAMAWLESLPIHERLEEKIWRRVRSYQQRYPLIMWERLERWLNLERELVPIADMKYRLTMRALFKWNALFPQYKELTADMRRLSSEVLDRNPYNSLSDLSSVIEHQLEDVQFVGKEDSPDWLKTLGACIARIKNSDSVKDISFKELGRRMMATAIITSSNIEIAPYIDSAPAGPPFSPDVAWEDGSLYVLDLPGAKLFESLVRELSTPFEDEKIERAIRSCLERTQDFINEYFDTNFAMEHLAEELSEVTCELEPISDKPKQGPDDVKLDESPDEFQDDGTYPEQDEPQDSDEDGEIQEAETKRQKQKRARLSLEEKYLRQKGFIKSADGLYRGTEDKTLRRVQGSFNWELYNQEGELLRQLWITNQSLAGGRIEIDADLWNLIRKSPEKTSIVLLDAEEKPVEFFGSQLISMFEQEKIRIAPLKYSMIWEAE